MMYCEVTRMNKFIYILLKMKTIYSGILQININTITMGRTYE